MKLVLKIQTVLSLISNYNYIISRNKILKCFVEGYIRLVRMILLGHSNGNKNKARESANENSTTCTVQRMGVQRTSIVQGMELTR